jgi:MinD-like ATPase involved in chromosome partitioning or flagellar assembly
MALAAARRDRVIAVDVCAEDTILAPDPVTLWYQVLLVDGPPGWSQPVPAAPLATVDTLVVATRADVADLSAAEDALTMFAGTAGTGRSTDGVPVVVAVLETVPARRSGRVHRRLARLSGQARAVVVVPFDPALTADTPFTWSGLQRRTRAAFGELADAVDPAS